MVAEPLPNSLGRQITRYEFLIQIRFTVIITPFTVIITPDIVTVYLTHANAPISTSPRKSNSSP